MAKRGSSKDLSSMHQGVTIVQPQSQENLKQKINALRAIFPNRSKNEVVLVLQHFDYSVDNAAHAFLEGNVSEILGAWNLTKKKAPKKKKSKAQDTYAESPEKERSCAPAIEPEACAAEASGATCSGTGDSGRVPDAGCDGVLKHVIMQDRSLSSERSWGIETGVDSRCSSNCSERSHVSCGFVHNGSDHQHEQPASQPLSTEPLSPGAKKIHFQDKNPTGLLEHAFDFSDSSVAVLTRSLSCSSASTDSLPGASAQCGTVNRQSEIRLTHDDRAAMSSKSNLSAIRGQSSSRVPSDQSNNIASAPPVGSQGQRKSKLAHKEQLDNLVGASDLGEISSLSADTSGGVLKPIASVDKHSPAGPSASSACKEQASGFGTTVTWQDQSEQRDSNSDDILGRGIGVVNESKVNVPAMPATSSVVPCNEPRVAGAVHVFGPADIYSRREKMLLKRSVSLGTQCQQNGNVAVGTKVQLHRRRSNPAKVEGNSQAIDINCGLQKKPTAVSLGDIGYNGTEKSIQHNTGPHAAVHSDAPAAPDQSRRDSQTISQDSHRVNSDIHPPRRDSNADTKDSQPTRRQSQPSESDASSVRRDSQSAVQENQSDRQDSLTDRRDSQSSRRDSQPNRRDSQSSRRDSQSSRRDSQSCQFAEQDSQGNRRDSQSAGQDSQPIRRDSQSSRRDSSTGKQDGQVDHADSDVSRRDDSQSERRDSQTDRRNSATQRKDSNADRRDSNTGRKGSLPGRKNSSGRRDSGPNSRRDSNPDQKDGKGGRRDSGGASKKENRRRPGGNIEKSAKDLQRCLVSLNRYQTLLKEAAEVSTKNIKTAFSEITDWLMDREVSIFAELDSVKHEAMNLLNARQKKAAELKKLSDKNNAAQMSEAQLAELRAEIKKFVSERKYDEDLSKTAHFTWERESIKTIIDTFGAITHPKVGHTVLFPLPVDALHEASTGHQSSSRSHVHSAQTDVQVATTLHNCPHPTAQQNPSAAVQCSPAAPAQLSSVSITQDNPVAAVSQDVFVGNSQLKLGPLINVPAAISEQSNVTTTQYRPALVNQNSGTYTQQSDAAITQHSSVATAQSKSTLVQGSPIATAPHSTGAATAHCTTAATPHCTTATTAHCTTATPPHSTTVTIAYKTTAATPHSTTATTAHSTRAATAPNTTAVTPHSTTATIAHSTAATTAHSTTATIAHSTTASTPHRTTATAQQRPVTNRHSIDAAKQQSSITMTGDESKISSAAQKSYVTPTHSRPMTTASVEDISPQRRAVAPLTNKVPPAMSSESSFAVTTDNKCMAVGKSRTTAEVSPGTVGQKGPMTVDQVNSQSINSAQNGTLAGDQNCSQNGNALLNVSPTATAISTSSAKVGMTAVRVARLTQRSGPILGDIFCTATRQGTVSRQYNGMPVLAKQPPVSKPVPLPLSVPITTPMASPHCVSQSTALVTSLSCSSNEPNIKPRRTGPIKPKRPSSDDMATVPPGRPLQITEKDASVEKVFLPPVTALPQRESRRLREILPGLHAQGPT